MNKLLELADIRDYLKTLDTAAENFYIGKLENKKEKSIGVYQLDTDAPIISLGGLDCTAYQKKSVSILIHWNKNAKETEIESYKLYNQLLKIRNLKINDIPIRVVNLLTNEPVDIGTDEKTGVYERVIQLEFYYDRKESE